jgi:hypothetical protein
MLMRQARQLAELLQHLDRHRMVHPDAAVARRLRPRPVRGQLELRRGLQLLLPVLDVPLELAVSVLLLLPGRVVAVLERRLGQLERLPGDGEVVELPQLVRDDTRGDAV